MVESIARVRHIRITPQKARRVVNLVRGKNAQEALAILKFAPQAASEPIYKLVASAVRNRRAIPVGALRQRYRQSRIHAPHLRETHRLGRADHGDPPGGDQVLYDNPGGLPAGDPGGRYRATS